MRYWRVFGLVVLVGGAYALGRWGADRSAPTPDRAQTKELPAPTEAPRAPRRVGAPPADLAHLVDTPESVKEAIDAHVRALCQSEGAEHRDRALRELVAIGRPAFPRILGRMAALCDQVHPDVDEPPAEIASQLARCDLALRGIDKYLDSKGVMTITVGHSRLYVEYICRLHYKRWLTDRPR